MGTSGTSQPPLVEVMATDLGGFQKRDSWWMSLSVVINHNGYADESSLKTSAGAEWFCRFAADLTPGLIYSAGYYLLKNYRI